MKGKAHLLVWSCLVVTAGFPHEVLARPHPAASRQSFDDITTNDGIPPIISSGAVPTTPGPYALMPATVAIDDHSYPGMMTGDGWRTICVSRAAYFSLELEDRELLNKAADSIYAAFHSQGAVPGRTPASELVNLLRQAQETAFLSSLQPPLGGPRDRSTLYSVARALNHGLFEGSIRGNTPATSASRNGLSKDHQKILESLTGDPDARTHLGRAVANRLALEELAVPGRDDPRLIHSLLDALPLQHAVLPKHFDLGTVELVLSTLRQQMPPNSTLALAASVRAQEGASVSVPQVTVSNSPASTDLSLLPTLTQTFGLGGSARHDFTPSRHKLAAAYRKYRHSIEDGKVPGRNSLDPDPLFGSTLLADLDEPIQDPREGVARWFNEANRAVRPSLTTSYVRSEHHGENLGATAAVSYLLPIGDADKGGSALTFLGTVTDTGSHSGSFGRQPGRDNNIVSCGLRLGVQDHTPHMTSCSDQEAGKPYEVLHRWHRQFGVELAPKDGQSREASYGLFARLRIEPKLRAEQTVDEVTRRTTEIGLSVGHAPPRGIYVGLKITRYIGL